MTEGGMCAKGSEHQTGHVIKSPRIWGKGPAPRGVHHRYYREAA